MKAQIRSDFKDHLRTLIPKEKGHIDFYGEDLEIDFNSLEYPHVEQQVCFVRFVKDELDSVYLDFLKDPRMPMGRVCLKFDYSDGFFFSRIYVSHDGRMDIAYNYDDDKKFTPYAKYFLKPSRIEPDLPPEDLNHQLDVLLEWREIMERSYREKNNLWVGCYQIEKQGKRIKSGYAGVAAEGHSPIYSESAVKMIQTYFLKNFDPNNCAWWYKVNDPEFFGSVVNIETVCPRWGGYDSPPFTYWNLL